MISSKYTIREQNEAQILNQIIKEKEISRAKLSQVTSLNKASVSAITKKLLADHLILEKRIGELNTPGRKPIMLTFNNKAALVIGLDLGYNYIDGMLSFLDGNEIRRFQLTETTITKENFFSFGRFRQHRTYASASANCIWNNWDDCCYPRTGFTR